MAILKVVDIHKRFGKISVLNGIDFSLEKGEVLSIIGSSGSGKTTLLRCLNMLETPESGKLYLNNELLIDFTQAAGMNETEIRQKRLHFGLVFQSFNLFPQYNILQNVTLAVKLLNNVSRQDKAKLEEIDEKAMDLLKRVGLSEKALSYPFQLSGGQQQRAAIARALALKPDILCFDEPTSALDPELTGEVLRVIKELKDSDTTMIIVTHEMEFARNVSDQIIFMANGVIEEQGQPEQVFTAPKSQRLKEFLSAGKY